MKQSEKPWQELQIARKCIDDLEARQKSIDEEQMIWSEFLNRLERVWFKSEAHFQKSPKWSGWKSSFVRQRDRDPLLRYLRFARGADTHSDEDHVIKTEERAVLGKPQLERIANLYPDGRIVASYQTLRLVESIPPKLVLNPILYRGVLIPVPTMCFGMPIDPNNLIQLGRMALVYYDDFLNQARAKFY